MKKAKAEPSTAGNEDKNENIADVDSLHAQRGFPCPEVGCVKVFVSSTMLEKHLDAGKHFYRIHKESTFDVIKRNWALRCTTVGTVKGSTSKSTDEVCKSPGQVSRLLPEKGWAMKRAKAGVRFSQDVKEFLNRIFLKGEETGQKANPSEVSSQLRKIRTPNGEKRFKRSEWLTVQQITSYFSRLSVLQKSGRMVENEDDDAEDVTMFEEALDRQQMSHDVASNLDL